MKLLSYLTFNGNCREGMLFYKDCLGGELHFQTVENSPVGSKLPGGMKEKILHATLIRQELVLMASDMVGEEGLSSGNAVSLLLYCSSEAEAKEVYKKLARGVEENLPVKPTCWGGGISALTDRFGHHWLLYCARNDQ